MQPHNQRIAMNNDQITVERNKWNVPNWRKTEEYKYVAHDYASPLVNDQLRWEFVRRHQIYREEWNNQNFCRSIFGLIEPIDPTLRGDGLGDRTILFIDSVLRGGIASMAIPKNVSVNEETFVKEFGAAILQFENDGFLILGFNPTLPERPQMDRASKIFNHHRSKLISLNEKTTYKEIPIEHPSQLLRVLDAYNEGISDIEIGETIYALFSSDAAGKSHARAIGHERIKEAHRCWSRVIPAQYNVLL